MHGKIRERRNYSNTLEHPNFAIPKHTNVIHDWRVSGEMVIYAFLLGFFSHSRKKE